MLCELFHSKPYSYITIADKLVKNSPQDMDYRPTEQPYGLWDIVLQQQVYSPPKYHSLIGSQIQRSMLTGDCSILDKIVDRPSWQVITIPEKKKKVNVKSNKFVLFVIWFKNDIIYSPSFSYAPAH